MPQPSLQVLIVSGPSDAARARAGASLAAAAAACGTRVFLFLLMDGARWLDEGDLTASEPAAGPTMSDLFRAVTASGGTLEVCSSCAEDLCDRHAPPGVGIAGLASVAVRLADMPTLVF
jgi:predicted peroxiredoxin